MSKFTALAVLMSIAVYALLMLMHRGNTAPYQSQHFHIPVDTVKSPIGVPAFHFTEHVMRQRPLAHSVGRLVQRSKTDSEPVRAFQSTLDQLQAPETVWQVVAVLVGAALSGLLWSLYEWTTGAAAARANRGAHDGRSPRYLTEDQAVPPRYDAVPYQWHMASVGTVRADRKPKGKRDWRGGRGRGKGKGGRGRREVPEEELQPLDCSDGWPRVQIKASRARLFKEGNPLVYAGTVAQVGGSPASGDIALVQDNKGNPIGWGMYNPISMFRVRLLSNARERGYQWPPDLPGLVSQRLAQAVALRRALGLPSEETTAYRLVHGEGDRLSGLVVDVFGALVVVQSSALWVERHRDVVEECLARLLPAHRVLWLQSESRLRQDGWGLAEEDAAAGEEPLGDSEAESEAGSGGESDSAVEEGSDDELPDDAPESDEGPVPGPPGDDVTVEIRESGLRYTVTPVSGQKTGFYCDQRDNRLLIRALAGDCHVLDLFSFTGGFGCNAALAGARSVTAVDSSMAALEQYMTNATSNGFEARLQNPGPLVEDLAAALPERLASAEGAPAVALYRADVIRFLRASQERGHLYDLLIVDPPKLCPQAKQLTRAARKYEQINAHAMRVLRPGGLMLTCTCSAAVAAEDVFMGILRRAAQAAGRKLTVLAESGAAKDHPWSSEYPEGRYLKAVLVMVS